MAKKKFKAQPSTEKHWRKVPLQESDIDKLVKYLESNNYRYNVEDSELEKRKDISFYVTDSEAEAIDDYIDYNINKSAISDGEENIKKVGDNVKSSTRKPMMKDAIKASNDNYKLKVTPYVINKGTSSEYYGLKDADENRVLSGTPTWKTKKGAIAWAKKKGYEVVDSSCTKKTVKASKKAVNCTSGQDVLSNGWVIRRIGKKWYLMSADEFSKYESHLEDFPKDWMVDSFPSKQALIQQYMREPFYKRMFEDSGYVGNGKDAWDSDKYTRNKTVKASDNTIKRYSDVVPKEDRKYWYFTTHGLGPGMIPRGVNVLKVQEGQNKNGTWGDFILLDAILNTDELKMYDLIELAPKNVDASTKRKPMKKSIKASASAKRRASKRAVKAANGYFAEDLNAANNRKILETLRDAVAGAYNGATIGDVEIGVYDVRDTVAQYTYKFEIGFHPSDYTKEMYLTIISGVELRQKFLCKVTDDNLKVVEEYMIPMSGCKQLVFDKIDEIANSISSGVEASTKKPVKCNMGDYDDYDEDKMPFRVTLYFDNGYRDISDGASFDDLSEAESYAHDCLSQGPVRIEHYDVGAVDIDPDEYWDNFDGEFACTPELAEWQEEVWKSIGINVGGNVYSSTKKSVKASEMYYEITDHYHDEVGRADTEDEARELAKKLLRENGADNYDIWWVDTDPDSTDDTSYIDTVYADKPFSVEGYYGSDFRGLSDSDTFYELRDALEHAQELLSRGNFVRMECENAGGRVEITPDEYEEFMMTEPEYFEDLPKLAEWLSDVRAERMDSYQEPWLDNWQHNTDIGMSTKAVKADLQLNKTDKRKYNWGKDPITDLDGYVKDIADGIIERFPQYTYEISDEAITFSDENGNVVFIQPVDEIVPDRDDFERDVDELSDAIRHDVDEEDWRKAMGYYDDVYNDVADYGDFYDGVSESTKAVKSADDADNLEYITGDDEPTDVGFGFDSNGDAIDESTVDELCRIANEILAKSELAQYDEYASIDRDTFDYYMSSPHVHEKFYIFFEFTKDGQWLLDNDFVEFADSYRGFSVNEDYTFECDIHVENGEVKEVLYNDLPDNYSADLLDLPEISEYIKELATPVAMEIYNGTTNL